MNIHFLFKEGNICVEEPVKYMIFFFFSKALFKREKNQRRVQICKWYSWRNAYIIYAEGTQRIAFDRHRYCRDCRLCCKAGSFVRAYNAGVDWISIFGALIGDGKRKKAEIEKRERRWREKLSHIQKSLKISALVQKSVIYTIWLKSHC